MGQIEVFNTYNLCTQPYCSENYTHCIRISNDEEVVGMILLCEKHYNKIIDIKKLFFHGLGGIYGG